MKLLSDKSVEMSRTSLAYRSFEDNYITCFEFGESPSSELVASLKRELRCHIDKLALEQKNLEAMVQECAVRARVVSLIMDLNAENSLANALSKQLELFLVMETFENGTNQSSLANDSNIVSGMMMVCSYSPLPPASICRADYSILQLYMYCVTPIALAAGIFSMNEKVMPFIPPTFQSFLGLSIGFGLISLSLHHCHQWRRRKNAGSQGQVQTLTQATTKLAHAMSTYLRPQNRDDIEQGTTPVPRISGQETQAVTREHSPGDAGATEDHSALAA